MTEVPLRNLPWVIVLSILFSYMVVFAAGFDGERKRHASTGACNIPLPRTSSPM